MFEAKPPNITGTRFELWAKKFNNKWSPKQNPDTAWHERLIIVTEKRLFIIARKQRARVHDWRARRRTSVSAPLQAAAAAATAAADANSGLEIVDSIPLEEIVSVDARDETDLWDDNDDPAARPPTARTLLTRSLRTASAMLDRFSVSFLSGAQCALLENGTIQGNIRKSLRGSVAKVSFHGSVAEAAPISPAVAASPMAEVSRPPAHQILRITTSASPDSFNRGCPYYFLLGSESASRSADSGAVRRGSADAGAWNGLMGSSPPPIPSQPPPPPQPQQPAAAERLMRLVARRRVEAARETRFLRLQRALRRILDSMPFNWAVLVLIVSNFAFTVKASRCRPRRL